MRVLNQTRGTVLAERATVARSFGQRLKGLLGKKNLAQGEGLWIAPCTSIHSCFMRFAFDAVFLDAEGLVLHQIEHMRPFRFSRWVPKARGVLELPAGSLHAANTQVGDRLRMEDV